MTPLQEFWHYFKRNKGAVVGLVYVVVMILIAVFANVLAPYNPAEQFRDTLLAPPAWQGGGTISTSICLVLMMWAAMCCPA